VGPEAGDIDRLLHGQRRNSRGRRAPQHDAQQQMMRAVSRLQLT